MRRIVIKSKVSKCNNKNENIEYKVKYKELIKPSVATKILNETFKYYSRFRLEFKEDEKYKVFDTIFNGEIYKIVVAKSKKDLKENIEKIVSDIGTNTALFVNLYNINIYNMDKEAEKTRDKRSDGERYSKIVKSKEYFTDVNAGVVVFGNFLLKGFLFASGLLSPTLKTILILNYVLSVSAIMTIDLEKLKRDDTTTFENIMLTYVGCVCGGLPLLIDCVAIGVSAAIDYLMGDIKIKLNKVINKFFKKRKTPKNYKGIEKEINEVEQNLKKDMIDLSLINPKENVPTVNNENSASLISEIKDLINKLPYDQRSEYEEKLSKVVNEEITEPRLTRAALISELYMLRDSIYEMDFDNNNPDLELEEYRNNEYTKARQ